jgi:class 3 adenylate cyclase/predicted ATPase
MFCDLVGSTELSTRFDPEDLREVIRAYQNTVAGEIARFEGHVAKFMGDGVLAYFGWPRAHEDEAERAVRAGLAATEVVGRLTAPTNQALAARIGVATGLVVVGDLMGEGAAQEEAVIGETPNLAARLQAVANPGEVVIATSTRRLLGDLFDLADLGQHTLKGLVEPIRAWRVLGESTVEGRFEALHVSGLTPLVGREEELGLLLGRWRQAKEGEGQVVLLSGEAGIGKSRIIQVLRERLADEPHTRLRYYCSPYHANSALYPVIGQLERAAGFQRDDPPELKLDKLEALLRQASSNMREAMPLFSALLSIPTGARYPTLDLTPQQRKPRSFNALLNQLEGLAGERPVLLVVEDAHWIDPTSSELFELVIDRIQDLSVLLVITFRPDLTPPWTGHAHVTSLTLNRLDRKQGSAMVDRVTGGKALPAEVLDQILAKSDGVPLFVEELTKAVLESGLLKERPDRYSMCGPMPPLAIPATLQDSLMARLDRLAPAKAIAQIGAVIGRQFSYELVAAVSPLHDAKLNEALVQLVDSELVFRRGALPGATYAFKHALVRDAAYQSLLRSKRQALHQQVASVLEERFPETAKTEPEVLAHHYTEAGLADQAIGYWQRAGERGVQRSANFEAVKHFECALELLHSDASISERAQKEIDLRLAIGASLIPLKSYGASEVRDAYERAEKLCRQSGNTEGLFPALRGLWNYHVLRCELEQASELAKQLLDLAQGSEKPEHLLMAFRIAGTTYFQVGQVKVGNDYFELGIDQYVPSHAHSSVLLYGEDPGIVCYNYSAWTQDYLGYRDRALSRIEKALTLTRESTNRFSFAFALAYAATLHQFRNEPAATQKCAETAITICEEQGIVQWSAWSAFHRGWALAAQDQAAEGIADIEKGLTMWRTLGARLALPHCLTLLADAYGNAGDTKRALEALDEAEAIVEQYNHQSFAAELYRKRGQLMLAKSKQDEVQAERHFLRAIEIARSQEAKTLELRAGTSLARLWRDQGKISEPRDLIQPIFDWFNEGFDTPDLKDAKVLLDELS